MYAKRNDSFLYTCKENFFLGIHPLSSDAKSSPGYQTLVEIFKTFFHEQGAELFIHYLNEEKYLCNVWAAHLIIEFAKPKQEVLDKCNRILKAASLEKVNG